MLGLFSWKIVSPSKDLDSILVKEDYSRVTFEVSNIFGFSWLV